VLQVTSAHRELPHEQWFVAVVTGAGRGIGGTNSETPAKGADVTALVASFASGQAAEDQ
jgi:hypothetical protein